MFQQVCPGFYCDYDIVGAVQIAHVKKNGGRETTVSIRAQSGTLLGEMRLAAKNEDEAKNHDQMISEIVKSIAEYKNSKFQ
jgi:hypothetical protein